MSFEMEKALVTYLTAPCCSNACGTGVRVRCEMEEKCSVARTETPSKELTDKNALNRASRCN